ncbi:Nucleotide-binding universal stress protein, UspA family [Halogeometricum rufum]|uniref:Nucleotide-binding universal stress protein, UspA family n=1 Tax=Halogeometricum rufum TaxID=553469 RepID=A0A1I6IIF2_9EURY|nr:Nucleotide-binding universal stress protein, UspA family [Halogeometricum rufum]
MYDTILIPTDGSEHAVRAAEHGRYLARLFDATVHVVNVADVQAAAGVFGAGGVDEEFMSRLDAKGEEAIEAVEDALADADSVETAIVRGDPREAILEYAEKHDVELLAMGTHGRTGLSRYITGSVTEHVVRTAEVPVLTVRATDRSEVVDGYDEILVPTDGSEPASAAVEHAIAIAQKAGARVHAVNVVDVGNVTASPTYTLPSEVIAELEENGQTMTEGIASQARAAGLDAVTEVREGFAARTLLDYAEENDVDAIAMGTAGRTGLDRYLLGSTTERVIRHSDVPVLAVNARERSD